MISDKQLGSLGLILSITGLSYLFFHVLLKPLLPLPDGHLNMDVSIVSLLVCALGGMIFIGTLSIFTLYVLYKKI